MAKPKADSESAIQALKLEMKEAQAPYKEKIKELKQRGSFKGAYVEVRKGTVEIAKSEKSEKEKKQALDDLFEKVSESMRG